LARIPAGYAAATSDRDPGRRTKDSALARRHGDTGIGEPDDQRGGLDSGAVAGKVPGPCEPEQLLIAERSQPGR
jgi:hypothetical protein